jgi:hypothetical protein
MSGFRSPARAYLSPGHRGRLLVSGQVKRHEFGSYLEVQVRFDDDDEHQTHWAFMIEAELPELWDDEARAELAAAGYLAVPRSELDGAPTPWSQVQTMTNA